MGAEIQGPLGGVISSVDYPEGGEGRIYTITYEVTDSCGNSTVTSATVTVPHSKKKK